MLVALCFLFFQYVRLLTIISINVVDVMDTCGTFIFFSFEIKSMLAEFFFCVYFSYIFF